MEPTPASFNPQTYQWETLRPPAFVSDLAELAAELTYLLPASLRPRRLTENFYICQVAQVESVNFNAAEQSVRAVVRDRQGTPLTLIHPYTTRGRDGTEALLKSLSLNPPTTSNLSPDKCASPPRG